MFKTKAERMKNKENYGINADELFHTNELTFRLRYRKEIKETDIVVYEGDRYRITSINKYLEDNQLIIMIQKINQLYLKKSLDKLQRFWLTWING